MKVGDNMWFMKNNEKKAVLIVHGFAGGTYDQEILANNLELEGFDVYTFTLPGHEKSFLKKVTRKEWIDECKYQIERFNGNIKIDNLTLTISFFRDNTRIIIYYFSTVS